jgi:Tfp pilus assembly major pilin PilA
MRMRGTQKGITLIGFLILLAVVGFFAYAAMKLIPAYTEYFGVVKSMKAVASDIDAPTIEIEQIRRKITLNFSVQYVDEENVPPNAIKLETQGGKRVLHIVYDRQLPFLYNVSLLVHFDHSEDMMRAAAVGT